MKLFSFYAILVLHVSFRNVTPRITEKGFGSHRGCHLENTTFLVVSLWQTFDMLLSIPDTTKKKKSEKFFVAIFWGQIIYAAVFYVGTLLPFGDNYLLQHILLNGTRMG